MRIFSFDVTFKRLALSKLRVAAMGQDNAIQRQGAPTPAQVIRGPITQLGKSPPTILDVLAADGSIAKAAEILAYR